jgi:NAD(P)-dependent dehydrogenase (short-subunit alcohol dehydrogenase family)
MLLENRNAVIYGGAGSIGSAVTRAFAREGATVHLAGRTLGPLEEVAREIRSAGGAAHVSQLDALDERAVDEHADAVAASAGTIDVAMNVIGLGDVHGTPLAEMPLEDFERPISTAVRSTFLTWRAAARHMIRQRSGVILAFGGHGDPLPDYYLGGFQVALGAIDYLRAQLARELGAYGVRVLTLQSAGVAEALSGAPGADDPITQGIVERTMLGRAPTLEDVANVAVFAASDHARTITATAINMTCGAELR